MSPPDAGLCMERITFHTNGNFEVYFHSSGRLPSNPKALFKLRYV